MMATPSRNLRGHNKPRCKHCGNVARSRCQYQACKSCCSKAENPCLIHVLKANATELEKTTSGTPPSEQQSVDASPPASSHRVASLRQLSSNFSQLKKLNDPLRARRPLTRKDAVAINEWRFSRLKEHRERKIEVENEAFSRYTDNISLLEEVFSAVTSRGEINHDCETKVAQEHQNPTKLTRGVESEGSKRKVRQIVDDGLGRIHDREIDKMADDGRSDLSHVLEKVAIMAEKSSCIDDLMDKLNKAQNEDDLKSIIGERDHCCHDLPKNFYETVEVDWQTIIDIDSHFSSLENIQSL